ncbi:LamG-like jellyroll fold domain-containing protein [Pseudofulvibacter geojedonensis]|uniref:LamG-like jellyroll fold domain-containing protein n=1 Tax=Pseudofulvibacter geojedonensis TaxID=1123758 RepID=A0ABW3HYZ1_9FLAO
MKTITHKTLCFYSILIGLISNTALAQLHAPPQCGENFTLDWTASPVTSNEYDWSPDGAITNTFSDVDASGIDFTVSFTGDTGTFQDWGGQDTPKVGTSASSGAFEGLDLRTSGFTVASGITCTITFSSPIYALSFDLYHVNKSSVHGDKYTISATTTSGGTILPTFTVSGNPSYTVDNSTGVVDATASSTAGDDAIVGVNFLDNDYITSVTFLWQDCSTCSINRTHGSGLGNFSFCLPQTLDFDGVNDYINRPAFLGGNSEITMMSWVRLDNGFTGGEIMGQKNLRVFVDSNDRLKVFVKTNGIALNSITTPDILAPVLKENEWCHVSTRYNGNKGSVDLFINGNMVWSYSLLTGNMLDNSASWNSDDFEIGRNTEFDNAYFKGAIYETRVYNVALTDSQLQRQVYQEIENNGGFVRGTVIPKNIEGLSWNTLILYYKMNIVNTGFTPDESSLSVDGGLNNMRTYQERNAPMPYVAINSGDWTDVSTWEHGDVWDIDNAPNSDCAIVRIADGVTINTTETHNQIGLLVGNNSELDVQNNAGIINTWYLKLDGKLDLNGESQLVQTEFSDLDVTSSGAIEIDQQGKSDVHSYNYWSAPVNPVNTTANNTNYTVANVLKDGSNPLVPQNINFITYSYDGQSGTPISLADFWMFKFVNSPDDYNNWTHIRSTGSLQVGEGYTQKGTGTSASSQNYVFEGKPNNGRKADSNAMTGNNSIQLPIGANNTYLVGNPFPSAIDAHKFIDDNIASIEDNGDVVGSGTTTGALYFWDHWGGESHNLLDYQGGYATLNKLGATYAIPDPGVSNQDTDNSNKALPQRYIPVGQGFFVQGDSDGGTIEFNNSQRVFEREMDGNSTFVSTATSLTSRSASNRSVSEGEDDIDRVYFNFVTPEGPIRQLLLGVKDGLTEMIDYGYDAELLDDFHPSECAFIVENKSMVIQGIGSIYSGLELPLYIRTGQDGLSTFTAESLADLDEDINVYFLDKETGNRTILESNTEASLNLPVGEYVNRFFIVFERVVLSVGNELEEVNNLSVYYNITDNHIAISNEKAFSLSNVQLFNMLGQEVYNSIERQQQITKAIIPNVFKTGAYLVRFKYNNEMLVSRKIIVK